MSTQDDDNQALKPKDLVFILAIAGRIDAQARISAQELEKSRHIYYAYSVVDSLSSSYSMFKYFFDVCLGGSADDMHDVLSTPGGIIGIALESLFLVGFSFLACHFDGADKGTFQKKLADAWPYFRDVMKGLKNAYKGWRSVVAVCSLMGVVGMNALIIPIGVGLGILAAANRYFMRSITEARKAMMVNNTTTLLDLLKRGALTTKEAQLYLKDKPNLKDNPIQYQTNQERYLGFASAGLGGLIDGLYLYAGALTLAVLAPPLLIALASFCAFYTLGCVITRLYEEYDFQLRLMITQTKCQLVLLTKQLQTHYAELLVLEGKTQKSDEELAEIQRLKKHLCGLIGEFDIHKKMLEQQTSRTYYSAALLGLKNGLYAYGALSSILFLVAVFMSLGGVAFPPAAVAAIVCIGLVFIVGFMVHSFVANREHLQRQKKEDEQAVHYKELLEMKQHLEAKPQATPSLSTQQMSQSLREGLSVKPAPQYFFQEWFEVIRSLFSGLGKGQKFSDFAGNSLQETDQDGHYQNTPIMYILGALNALFFGIVLGLRALARGLGRPTLGQTNDLSSAVIDPDKTKELIKGVAPGAQEKDEETKTQGVVGESSQIAQRPDSLKHSTSATNLVGFFKSPKPQPKPLHRVKSELTLTDHEMPDDDTIVGLN
jgi:hypothetical protein